MAGPGELPEGLGLAGCICTITKQPSLKTVKEYYD